MPAVEISKPLASEDLGDRGGLRAKLERLAFLAADTWPDADTTRFGRRRQLLLRDSIFQDAAQRGYVRVRTEQQDRSRWGPKL